VGGNGPTPERPADVRTRPVNTQPEVMDAAKLRRMATRVDDHPRADSTGTLSVVAVCDVGLGASTVASRSLALRVYLRSLRERVDGIVAG
jgi:hypothetical protein